MDHLTFRQHRIDLAQIDDHVATDIALNFSGDDLILLVKVIRIQAHALSLAHLLHDDVLCALDRDAVEPAGIDFLRDNISKLVLSIPHLRVAKRDLCQWILDIFHDRLVKVDTECTFDRVHPDRDIRQSLPFEVLLAGNCQRGFDRIHQHFCLDAFFLLK